MMSSTCIVRTAVVRKPGLGLGFVVLVLVLVLRIWSCSHHWTSVIPNLDFNSRSYYNNMHSTYRVRSLRAICLR